MHQIQLELFPEELIPKKFIALQIKLCIRGTDKILDIRGPEFTIRSYWDPAQSLKDFLPLVSRCLSRAGGLHNVSMNIVVTRVTWDRWTCLSAWPTRAVIVRNEHETIRTIS